MPSKSTSILTLALLAVITVPTLASSNIDDINPPRRIVVSKEEALRKLEGSHAAQFKANLERKQQKVLNTQNAQNAGNVQNGEPAETNNGNKRGGIAASIKEVRILKQGRNGGNRQNVRNGQKGIQQGQQNKQVRVNEKKRNNADNETNRQRNKAKKEVNSAVEEKKQRKKGSNELGRGQQKQQGRAAGNTRNNNGLKQEQVEQIKHGRNGANKKKDIAKNDAVKIVQSQGTKDNNGSRGGQGPSEEAIGVEELFGHDVQRAKQLSQKRQKQKNQQEAQFEQDSTKMEQKKVYVKVTDNDGGATGNFESVAHLMAKEGIALKPLEDKKESNDKKKENGRHSSHDVDSLNLNSNTSNKARNSRTHNDTTFPYKYPAIRYMPWSQLSEDTRSMLQKPMRYRESTWDNLGKNEREGTRFSELESGEKDVVRMLGLDENVWDCFIHHYLSYGRKDLVQQGLDEDAALINSAWSKSWDEMTTEEISAANRFCYFEEIWQELPLGTW